MAEKVGKRRTSQREAILGVIREAAGPLTVQEILDAASRETASLGVATVYRTVKLLLEAGKIRSVTLPDGHARYEAADLQHHHHFRCRNCDRVFDLEGCPVGIPAGTTLPGGYRVEDHELTLYGLCPACHKD